MIPQLHVREAAELAYFGAKVLHPRALIPVSGRSIPVFVRPFADATAAGTEISARRTLDRYPVKALSAVGGQALLTVAGNGMLGVPGIAARTFEALHLQGISVSLISQSSSEQSICFSVPEGAARRARDRLTEEFRDQIARGEIDGIDSRSGLATVAVVGIGMAGHLGIAARVFAALAEAKINIVAIAQGSSELNISFVVAAKDVAAAQRAVHGAFQLSKIGGGAAARAAHTDAVLLGFGQIGRALAKIMAQGQGGKNGQNGKNGKKSKLRLVAAIDRRGFVFDPNGLPPRVVAALSAAKEKGKSLAEAPGGRAASPADALAALAEHALGDPILVDVTADESTPLIRQALGAGMDVVLANKRPISGPRAESEALAALAESAGRRLLTEATVGAGLPIFDTHRKLVESGDRVLKIRRVPLGDARLRADRGREGAVVLRGARPRDGARLHRARPARRSVGRRRRAQGADPRTAAGLRRRAGRRRGRIAGAGGDEGAPPRAVPRAPPRRRRRLVAPRRRRQGQGRHAPLRRDGHQGPDLRRAEGRRPARARSTASRGPTTRSPSRPRATARTRWSSPAPAPARPSRRPACSTTCSASAADRRSRLAEHDRHQDGSSSDEPWRQK